MIAMMFAIAAFSIDSILPAVPMIASDLGLSSPKQVSLILTSFLLGLGIGTLFAGPLSDAFGRRPIVFWGLAIFALGAILAWVAPNFELMLAARILQGIGAAGPRIVSGAIVRDKCSGAEMASILSFSLILFLIVPALAPMMGAAISEVFHWRAIFAAYVIFGVLLLIWYGSRQGETLVPADGKPLSSKRLWLTTKEIFAHPTARTSITLQVLMMSLIFSVLTMVQQIFDMTYGRADTFPYWFGAIAVVSASSSLFNAWSVKRVGMRRLVTSALHMQIAFSFIALVLLLLGAPGGFWIYLVWQLGVLMQVGLTTANLNSMAMEPMGHIAGTTASVIGATSIIGGAIVASLLAQLFDGTPVPLICIALVLSCVSSLLMASLRRAEAAMA